MTSRWLLSAVAATGLSTSMFPTLTIVHAQATTQSEAFDVISIRENRAGATTSIRQQPLGITATNATALDLIRFAFDVIEREVVGELPAWVRATRFDVAGRTELGPLTRSRLRAMTRAMLEDRFRLDTSRERAMGPVYSLVRTRSELRPFDGTTVGMRPSQTTCVVDPLLRTPGEAATPVTRTCGFAEGIGGALTDLFGYRVTMQGLARQLSRIGGFDRPIVDRTGLTGEFDLTIHPTPDMVAPTPAARFLIALREQLGLELRAEEGSFDVLRVRRIEQPAPN